MIHKKSTTKLGINNFSSIGMARKASYGRANVRGFALPLSVLVHDDVVVPGVENLRKFSSLKQKNSKPY